MCIRDRRHARAARIHSAAVVGIGCLSSYGRALCYNRVRLCLLYTSDAADERSSVDLGGRRIIKKKKKYMREIEGGSTSQRR